MLEYESLDDEEKRKLKEALHIERMSRYYLEDNDIVLMKEKELLEYIYLDDMRKVKDAINFIDKIINYEIEEKDANKTIGMIILERNKRVIKLSDRAYAYKD